MTTLAANSNVTLTLTAYDSVTIESRGPVLVEAVSGLGVTAGKVAELQGMRTLGPYTESGSLKLTSYGQPIEYQVADGSNPSSSAQFAYNADGSVAGLRDGSGKTVSSVHMGRQRKGRLFKGTYGRLLAAWSGASLQNSGGTAALVTTSDLPSTPDGATKVMRLTANAAQSFGQQTVEVFDHATAATPETIGFWVNNRSGASLSIRGTLFNIDGGRQSIFNATIDPTDGWRFLTVGPKSIIASTLLWGTDVIHFVRIAQMDSLGDAWPTGASVDIGSFYIGCKARPRFMLTFDDGKSSVYHPAALASGWPASGRSCRQVVEYYGFHGTLYLITSRLNTSTYLTTREALEMQAAGWLLGTHSRSHPEYSGRGLTSLGPTGFADAADPWNALATNNDTAIHDDVVGAFEDLHNIGGLFPDCAFALPQGAWDASVRTALARSGAKHIRALSAHNTFNTVSIGRPTGGGGSGSTKTMGGWIHQGDGYSTDTTANVNANIATYVDNVIAYGATGSNYHHSSTLTMASNLDYLCSYLRTKVDAGLIDVVTPLDVTYDDDGI